MFIVGHLRGRSTSEVFPVKGADGESVHLILDGCIGGRNSQSDRIYSKNGLCPTIATKPGGNTEPKVAIPCFIDLSYKKTKLTDTARCLQARYCKGIANHKAEVSGVAIPVITPDRSEKRQNGRRFKEDGEPMFTLTGQDRHGVAIEPIGGIYTNVSPGYQRGIYEDCFRCLKSNNHDSGVVLRLNTKHDEKTAVEGNELAIKVSEATKQGYAECRVGIDSVNFAVPNSKTRRGRVGHEIANTLDTGCNQGIFVQVSEELTVYAVWYEKYQCYIAIRKLTPRECFRLQGWTDDYFEKAAFVNSDSQLYKQAGNGVTVTVIEAMARKMNVNLN